MTDLRCVTLNGYRVAYRDEGDRVAQALLLIHGVAGCSGAWDPLIGHLSQKYRVIAPDLLGHGESDKPRTDYSLGAFAVMLRDFLDVLDIPSATLVGHSLGGGIALQLVHQHREYCRRLVLVNSGGLGSDVGLPLRVLSAPGAELLLALISSRPALYFGWTVWPKISTRSMEPTRALERREKYSALANPQVRHAFLRTLRSVVDIRGQSVCALDRLPDLVGDLPTLIVAGAQDRVIPPAHAQAAHEVLAGSRLEILDGAGHHPQLDCPLELADLIEEFVSADNVRMLPRRGLPRLWRPTRRGEPRPEDVPSSSASSGRPA
jgi:pimeloyl-ACP methyl ester carboxylesterase